MIYQFKKMTSPQKTEEVSSSPSVLSANKFQRTAKKTVTTTEQTNANSQKTQSAIAQEVKQVPVSQKPRIISRTNKLTQKKQTNRSPIYEEPSPVIVKSRSPQTSYTPNLALQQRKPVTSKIEEPPATIFKKQQTKQVQQVKTISLKKSELILHSICRLRRNTLINAFYKLNQNNKEKKVKNQVQAKVLILTSSQITKKFETNFYQEFIDKLKIVYSKKSQQNSKIEVSIFQSNFKRRKENLINLLNIISKLKMKEVFDKLKTKTYFKNNILRAAPTLIDFYEKRKIREAFVLLKQSSLLTSLMRKLKLTNVSNIRKFIEKEHYKKVFMKLNIWNVSQKLPTKEIQKQKSVKNIQIPNTNTEKNTQQLTNKIEKIKNQKEKNEKEIYALENKLKKLKKDQENEKKPLQKNIEELKNMKKQNEKQIEQKKSTNKQWKIQIENESKIQGAELLSQNDEKLANDKLSNLERMYFTLSRTQDEDLNTIIDYLVRQNQASISSSNKAIDDWQLILKKSQLQREINNYENAIIGQTTVTKQQNSITKLVQEQNDMLKTMIRNYIKQRYLWSEVQKYLSSMV